MYTYRAFQQCFPRCVNLSTLTKHAQMWVNATWSEDILLSNDDVCSLSRYVSWQNDDKPLRFSALLNLFSVF